MRESTLLDPGSVMPHLPDADAPLLGEHEHQAFTASRTCTWKRGAACAALTLLLGGGVATLTLWSRQSIEPNRQSIEPNLGTRRACPNVALAWNDIKPLSLQTLHNCSVPTPVSTSFPTNYSLLPTTPVPNFISEKGELTCRPVTLPEAFFMKRQNAGTEVGTDGMMMVDNFNGAVLLPDGRVVFVPCTFTNVVLFEPSTGTLTLGPAVAGTYVPYDPWDPKPDGRPFPNLRCTSHDPRANDRYRDLCCNNFNGGVLLPDGRVVFVPATSTTVGIFDPSTGAFNRGPNVTVHLQQLLFRPISSGADNNLFRGGVLLPDGRVVFVPFDSTTVGLFDPSTSTYTSVNRYNPIQRHGFSGGVLLPDGRVVFVPYDWGIVVLFDPSTNTYTVRPGTDLPNSLYKGASTALFGGGVLLPDGRVVFVPSSLPGFIGHGGP
eukprot:COSAG02_NODE_5336_length_4426_cov_2.244973_6_plen_433_part_01